MFDPRLSCIVTDRFNIEWYPFRLDDNLVTKSIVYG
jgi:hypothetical protein